MAQGEQTSITLSLAAVGADKVPKRHAELLKRMAELLHDKTRNILKLQEELEALRHRQRLGSPR